MLAPFLSLLVFRLGSFCNLRLKGRNVYTSWSEDLDESWWHHWSICYRYYLWKELKQTTELKLCWSVSKMRNDTIMIKSGAGKDMLHLVVDLIVKPFICLPQRQTRNACTTFAGGKLFRQGSPGDCLGLLHPRVNELTTVLQGSKNCKWFVWDGHRCCCKLCF